MAALSQIEATTDDYFVVKGKKAQDNYFKKAFVLDYLLKQKKGLFEKFSSGYKVRVPFRYDGNEAQFYKRGETVSSDKREAITAAFFIPKHACGNATILRVDELANNGPEGHVKLVFEEVEGGQLSLSQILAQSFWENNSDSSERLNGFISCTAASSSAKYGDLAYTDVVAEDGSYPWNGASSSSAVVLNLQALRTAKSAVEYGTGKRDEPDLIATTKTLYNKILNQLQIQQQFTPKDSEAVRAGFLGIWFEGSEIFPDKFIPSGYVAYINTDHYGFAVHSDGMFYRGEWEMIQGTPGDKSMKIYFDGVDICDNRRAQYLQTSVS